ncbi:MAG: AI-2E family transporter [Clostridia bacterium]|nr:AI-2E family transporter [Clostridia bacterium]
MDNENKGGRRHERAVTLRVLVIFAVCFAILTVILNIDSVETLFKKTVSILSPVLIGIMIAYILNPICKFLTGRFVKLYQKRGKVAPEKAEKRSTRFAVIISMFLLLAVIIALLFLIIPEFAENLQKFINRAPDLFKQVYSWLEEKQKADDSVLGTISGNLLQFLQSLTDRVNDWLTGDVSALISAVGNGLIGVVSFLFDILIAFIICAYALLEKKSFIAQSKKMIFAIFKPERANDILTTARYGNDVFGKYITGKVLTSTLVGILTFLFMSLFNMPYSLLASVIVAVTNVIPFFGPFIGGVPTAFIILITDFKQGIIYIIFLLVLQQIEGNILEPLIMEDRTGVSKFWVTFALLLFGGMFGIMGMILSLPIFAVIYYVIKVFVERKLAKRDLPTESSEYLEAGAIDPQTNELLPAPKQESHKPRLSIKSIFRALLGKKVTQEETPPESAAQPPAQSPEAGQTESGKTAKNKKQ